MQLDHDVEVTVEGGELASQFGTLPHAKDEIAFVHLPKTGGSSIIAAFVDRLGPEACLAFSATIEDRDFEARRFVAGHVYLGDVTSRAKVFTFVRDPVVQIASHLLWLDHYTMPEFEEEARGFSPEIRNVFAIVKEVDLSSARSLSAFLESHPRDSEIRLANIQAELLSFCHGFVDPIDDAELARRAIASFSRLDFVGVTEHLAADLGDLFRLLGLPGEPEVKHLNASPAARRIDLSVSAIRRALEAHVGADLRLWEAASALRERRLRAA